MLINYPKEKGLTYFLNRCAEQHSVKIAIKYFNRELTYKEIYESSNKLSRLLIDSDVKPGDIVGIALDRSPEMIISLLAILKSGAAYVPLDPGYPKDRIEFMLKDSSAKILLTSYKYHNHFNVDLTEILIEDAWLKLDNYVADKPTLVVNGDSLAYILYTSGSTGKPKGVQIRHYSLVNFLLSMQKEPGMNAYDKILAVTTISFDIAGLEIYLPLISGAQIVLASSEATKDGWVLLDIIRNEKVSFMQATPYTWRIMLESNWEEKIPLRALCGGEPLPKDLANKLINHTNELWNVYGPTETTIWSTIKLIINNADITIGKPINNTYIYILDESLHHISDGSIGEIFIAGDGVAKGYLNREDLTAERFIDNPFSDRIGDKMYRTGDLGKLNNNGEIQCLGRIDHQVKIRGYRIELEEVEYALVKLPDIKEATVIAREDNPGNPILVGYVTLAADSTKSDLKILSNSWKQALLSVLPKYMVPDGFVLIDSVPITPNGKIDRKALLKTNYSIINHKSRYVPPRTAIEKQVIKIWKESLGIEKISVYDNFFLLGGHSLMAIKMLSDVKKLTGKHVSIILLTQYPTVDAFIKLLDRNDLFKVDNVLVPLKNSGNKRPLYLVNGGEIVEPGFFKLANTIDREQPLYGFQSNGYNSDGKPLITIEETAAYYVKNILIKDFQGPYCLAAYSLGGVIAFEMAKQLKNMGKTVKVLIMIDCIARDPTIIPVEYTFLTILKLIALNIYLIKDGLPHAFKFTVRYLKKIKVLSFIKTNQHLSVEEEISDNQFDVFKMHSRAYKKYILTPYDDKLIILRAKKILYYISDFKYLGWKPFGKKIKSIPVKGDHYSLFYKENISDLCEKIQKTLEEAL